MEVTVVGAGYVGLVSASCLAETGSNVRCVDINEQRIADLRQGKRFLSLDYSDGDPPRLYAGQALKLDALQCLDEPGPLGCALVARVSWALAGDDGRGATFATSGELTADDRVAPLTF